MCCLLPTRVLICFMSFCFQLFCQSVNALLEHISWTVLFSKRHKSTQTSFYFCLLDCFYWLEKDMTKEWLVNLCRLLENTWRLYEIKLNRKITRKMWPKVEICSCFEFDTRSARDGDVFRCTILKYAYAYFFKSTGIHVLKEF